MEYLSALKKSDCCRVDDRDRLYCFFEYGQFNRGIIFIRIRTFYDYQFGIEFVYLARSDISVKKIVPRH